MKKTTHILPIIVVSQFFCTSLWFAGNGVMSDLMAHFNLEEVALGYLTSSVQLGFIFGTLIFALLSFADRFSPSKLFFICAVLGAGFNLGITWSENALTSILIFRFFTGFFLAGIYPVGMKIAADYFEKGLGKSLGFLVGALVVGTAFPHILKEAKGNLPWEFVIYSTSTLAIVGGTLMVFLVPNGPYRKPSQQLNFSATIDIFKAPKFRSAAFGYFGHMWELYAFWAFVPVIIQEINENSFNDFFNVPLSSFLIIGIGGLFCIAGGYLAQKYGDKRIAFIALLLSCLCCLLSPLIFILDAPLLILGFLFFWGMVVIADSPLFSTLVAQNAPVELKGTALTIVNCIGFFITIVSIQVVNYLNTKFDSIFFLTVLAIGPILGLLSLRTKSQQRI